MNNEDKPSSKNPIMMLIELIIKGVMGFFMVFYLLWKNTAQPLHKEVYEGHYWCAVSGSLAALAAGAVSIPLLLPLTGPLAIPLSLLITVLTYSHLFPLFYIIILRPLKKVLNSLWTAIKSVLKPIARCVWRFVRWCWQRFASFWQWLANKVIDLWQRMWDQVKRFLRYVWPHIVALFRWLDNIITSAWDWLHDKAQRFIRFAWPHIVSFYRWLANIVTSVWNWVSDKVEQLARLVWPHIVALYNWLANIINTVWNWVVTKVQQLAHWLWPRIVATWNWVLTKIQRVIGWLWPHIVAVWNWLERVRTAAATLAKKAWHAISSRLVAMWNWLIPLISPYIERLSQLTGRFFKQLLVWGQGVWSALEPMIDSISAWSKEMWDSLSRLFARLSHSNNK